MNTQKKYPAVFGLIIVIVVLTTVFIIVKAAVSRVTDVAVYRSQGTRVILTWTAPVPAEAEDLLELDLRMSTTPISSLNFGSRTRVALLTDPGTPSTLQTATITDLSENTTYYFAMKNRGTSGWSTMSNLVTTETAGSTAEPVGLAWDPNSEADVTGYKLYYGTAPGTYTEAIDVGNAVTKDVTGLVYDTTYYFSVTAYNAEGLESAPSNEISYTP